MFEQNGFTDSQIDAVTAPAGTVDAPTGEPALAARAHRVLVVEDHHLNRRLAGLFLSKMNCHQTYCDDGLKALNLVQEEEFDLVLMDVNMPVMDGLTATRAIRALQSRSSKVPIVAYSADVTRENRELSMIAGANAFLPKPVDFHSFRSVVQGLLPPVREPIAGPGSV